MRKNITTGAIVLALIALAAWWYNSSRSGAVPISASGTEGPTLELVGRLQDIKIDTSFFNDQQFLDLEAAPKTDVTGISKGRSNPFSPARR